MNFDELGLAPEILRAVHDAGYTEPTPIQQQAIPVVLQGHDLMGGAQTGTGKTAGFVLPMLQRLSRHANASSSPARHPVRALILTPTRELAMQVHESVKTYSKHLPLRSVCVYGGVDIKPQTAELKEGREIVVATPGRLLDHVQQKSVHFSQVEVRGARRSRPHARHGLHPRHQAHPRHAAEGAAEPAVLGHLLRGNQEAGRRHAQVAATDRGRASQHRLRDHHPSPAPRRHRPQAPPAAATAEGPVDDPGAGLRRHQVRRQPPRELAGTSGRRSPTPSTATKASSSAPRRSKPSSPARRACWSPPTSPRAGWTSTTCRTSSTTNCRTPPRTTSTASAAPAAPARRATPSRWWRPRKKAAWPTSSAAQVQDRAG